ncbi:hypothetical protein B0I35DRAFT_473420 [Stachybotrys elegans]|uniref:Rho-GAP domain-containing protein n=1 Tax=Stachybotrys elegans TaxID=80388 RepID=A0A8K0T7F8_9HYPO|nr:hypothetical protein B0I35DRAFT_473420 [Stachybotrys elegans]
MARKPAPQPLMLANSQTHQPTQSQPQSPSQSPSQQQQQPGHVHSKTASDTPPTPSHARASPSEPKTPRSPRSSPFSAKFGGTSRSQPNQATPRQPSLERDRENLSHLNNPQNQTHKVSQSISYDRDDTSVHHQKPYPSISTALEEPLPGPLPEPAPLRHAQTEGRKVTKGGFFHFNKPSKSSNQLASTTHPPPPTDTASHAYKDDQESTTSQSFTGLRALASPTVENKLQKSPPAPPSRSDLSLSSSSEQQDPAAPNSGKRSKQKTFARLGRTKSQHDKEKEKERDKEREMGVPGDITVPMPVATTGPEFQPNALPPRTAPVAQDRTFRDMMNSTIRNRSEDRVPSREGSSHRDGHHHSREREHRQQLPSAAYPVRENGGSTFLSGLRNSSTRAADYISKGFFGKSSRSANNLDREPVIDDEHYVLKVINLPLIEQTRLTRISKRLETSKDKTEFWMPAFAWRAIDYLNYKGCDVEGLYRVPGSGPQIKKWQRRFDEHYDVNLFEADDLYDINIIGSMLKAWLRELPDELFPKEAQERVARECAGAVTVPQLLVEELSNLSPFQYYLLFAITCHLSLLLAHSDKNKMDFRNLCICFQPCMKIDAFCFKFLVCDWRDCWQGCKTEARFIEEEYKLFEQAPPRGLSEPQQFSVPSESQQEPPRQASPDKMQQAGHHTNGEPKSSSKRKPVPVSTTKANASYGHQSTMSSGGAMEGTTGSGDLRPLSPIKPLSPLGI